MEEKTGCQIEFKRHGLEITGKCAEGLSSIFSEIFSASKEEKAEISAYACVNPKTGSIEKVVLGRKGTSSSTSFPYSRVCPLTERQISMHSHPTSGIPKFSETDAKTITHRMNEGKDDVSCVLGEESTQCFAKALIPNKKR